MHPVLPLVQGFDLYLLCIVSLIEITRMVNRDGLREFLVSTLAASAYRLSHRKRQQIRNNLQNAFHDALSPVELERITRSVFRAFWQEIFDWSYQDSKTLAKQAQIVGAEHLHAALAHGRGVILWESSSFGKRVIGKHLLHAIDFDVTQVHARLHAGGLGTGQRGMSRLLDRIILPYFDARTREIVRDVIYLDENAALGSTRNLLQHLTKNAILCVAIEGRLGQKHLTLPFLGKPYPFATGIVTLAKLSGAPLIPLYCTPAVKGTYRLEIGPPLPLPQDLERDALFESVLTRQVCDLDARIRRHPDWYWSWNLLQER